MAAIEEMEFGCLKFLQKTTLDLEFLRRILDDFEPHSYTLGGVEIADNDVHTVLGIPPGTSLVPKSVFKQEVNAIKGKFGKKTLAKLKEDIKITEVVDEDFKKMLLLYILANFLCPAVKDKLSEVLYSVISVASDAQKYNWAKFVLKWLVDTVKNCEKRGKGGIEGYLFFLKVDLTNSKHNYIIYFM